MHTNQLVAKKYNEEFAVVSTQISILRFVLSATLALLLAGCASSTVVIGQTRPAISPEQVKLYLHPPKKYEEIALVESSSRNSWAITSQGKMNKVIQRMKDEAANVGANGILIQGVGSEYGGSVNTGVASANANGNTAYGTGFGSSAAVFHKAGSGVAIYVEEE